MDDRIFEGKDLEEALQAASSELGIADEELHYEILDTGRRGVFGLGVKSVRIRIQPPLDEMASGSADAPGAADPSPPPDRPPADGPSPPAADGSRRRRGSRPRGRGRSTTARSADRPEPAPAADDSGRDLSVERPPVDEAVAGKVEETVGRMLGLMGLELDVRTTGTDGGVTLEIEGEDQKMLVERSGELLSSIQFLLNRMARRAWPGAGRVQLVCDGVRSRRDDEIVELTREVAQQVSSTGRTKKLQPLNAYERRLVHLTVREFGGLTSSSDGQGSRKRVKISKIRNKLD